MNHKRHRPKSMRAGCLMCKPHKRQGAKRSRLPNLRFGQIKQSLRYAGMGHPSEDEFLNDEVEAMHDHDA